MDAHTPEGSTDQRPVEIEVVRGALTRVSLVAQTRSGALQGDPERYAETFAEALGEPLRAGGAPVVCEIREGAVFYAGTEVSGNDLVIRGIVQHLMHEGVSAITLLPGIPREELLELCHLLTEPTEEGGAVDAVVTMGARAWSLQLAHVHFETVATRVVTEADDRVRPMDLVGRLTTQLGLSEDILEPDAYMELAATLGGVRALADAPRAVRVDRPATGSVWGRALREVRHQRDVPSSALSLLVTESLRAATDPTTTTAVARAWLDRVRQAFGAGDPVLAGQMLRPVLILADAHFRPIGFDAAPVRAALDGFLGRATRTAIVQGIQRHPQTDDWVGVLFSLGTTLGADQLLDFAAVGHTLEAGPIREALGDALATSVDRLDAVTIRSLLSSDSDEALPVLLQAARRFTDPTLIEPLLARTRHEAPSVREAALLALRAQQSPRIKTAARDAIADDHRSVRLEALRYVSVYRDTDSAPIVSERLRTATPKSADLEELKALAIAWLHTSRGTALPELEALAAADHRHPDIPAACVVALSRAGAPGKQALDRLGRAHPALRPVIREHTALRGQERRP